MHRETLQAYVQMNKRRLEITCGRFFLNWFFHSNFLSFHCAIWVILIYKVSSIVPSSFLEGMRVETSFKSIFFAVSPPHQPSNKFRNNNYPIHFYALIWRNWNERAINFIQLNCIICITNTLIEKWIWYLTRLSLLGPFDCTYRHLRKICDTKNKSLMNNECALETARARSNEKKLL